MTEDLKTRLVAIDGLARLIVEGEIDVLTVEQFRAALLEGVSAATEELRVDMVGVRFLGSQGLAALLDGRSAGHACGVSVRVTPCSPEALRALAASGLLQAFGLDASSGR